MGKKIGPKNDIRQLDLMRRVLTRFRFSSARTLTVLPLLLLTPGHSTPRNHLSVHGASLLSDFGELGFGYEREADHGRLGFGITVSGSRWPAKSSLIDSNARRIDGMGLKLAGKQYFKDRRYVEISGAFQGFDENYHGSDFRYFSFGLGVGQRYRIGIGFLEVVAGYAWATRYPHFVPNVKSGPNSRIFEFGEYVHQSMLPGMRWEVTTKIGFSI